MKPTPRQFYNLDQAAYYVLRKTKQLIIITLGFSVLGIGVAMLVLPGPAIIVIPIGLAILATELVWARHVLKKIKRTLGMAEEEKEINEERKS